VSAAELAEWRAFYAVDPWGEQRADMRMSQIMWAALLPHVKSRNSLRPADWLLYPDKTADLALVEGVEERELQWMKMLRMNEGN
jgi:hypothetical protein